MIDREELERLHEAATPGPYRVHDHNDMARVGGDPAKWLGYAWVGRVTKSSSPNGEFDAGWFKTDRRKDGCVEYRERASSDANLIAYLCNAVPGIFKLMDERDTLEAENARLRDALMPFVEGYSHTSVFLSTCERMHTAGRDLYREDVNRARAALKGEEG